MKQETQILQKAERMSPLIRSIMQEAVDRAGEIQKLEAQQEELLADSSAIDDLRRIEFELFRHRRELELVHGELARLGCSIDPEHPDRIVWSVADSEFTFQVGLNETGFRPLA